VVVVVMIVSPPGGSGLGPRPGPKKADPPAPFTNSSGMKMMPIPAGEFFMGAPEDDPDAEPAERPRHKVRITRPFYMSAHEVTVGQFRAFVKATQHRTTAENARIGGEGFNETIAKFDSGREFTWESPGWKLTDDHPVVNVSWWDADEFCRWLSDKEGKKYTLPTEAQWEYACRAGSTTRFPDGDSESSLRGTANIADLALQTKLDGSYPNFRFMQWDDGYPFTAPVGRFKANAWGLFDLTGNVAEWCADYSDPRLYTREARDDPTGPARGSKRIVRGGHWKYLPIQARSSQRVEAFPEVTTTYAGFRVVCTVPASK
jgi:formylglycine-generating enzyme required for sulfatase activity